MRFSSSSSPVPVLGLESVGVEGRGGVLVGHGVAGVAGAEEGLVVVLRELGQPRHQLLHRQLLHPAGPPPARTDQPRLLQVVLQPGPINLLDVQRRQLRVARQSSWGQPGPLQLRD